MKYGEESSNIRLLYINNFIKKYDHRVLPYQLCEICFKSKNLIICSICKSFFHLKCLNLIELPLKYICENCKEFTVYDKKEILNNIYENKSNSVSLNICKPEIENICNLNYFKETRKSKKEISKVTHSSSLVNSQTYSAEEASKKLIKPRKKRINNFDDVIKTEKVERKDIFSFDNSEIHYKKRKIKIGVNHNIDIEEYYDRIENECNLDDIDYERKEMKKVWSRQSNLMSEKEIENYINKARIFWTYRNLNIENELCADFFDDLNEYLKDNKLFNYNKGSLIQNKIVFLKNFLKNGIHLNCHFDEMALKILHISKYKEKVALLFLFKQFNPFIEEVEESFKNDVIFFQKEILSILSDDEN